LLLINIGIPERCSGYFETLKDLILTLEDENYKTLNKGTPHDFVVPLPRPLNSNGLRIGAGEMADEETKNCFGYYADRDCTVPLRLPLENASSTPRDLFTERVYARYTQILDSQKRCVND
jgi:hypothetical protein